MHKSLLIPPTLVMEYIEAREQKRRYVRIARRTNRASRIHYYVMFNLNLHSRDMRDSTESLVSSSNGLARNSLISRIVVFVPSSRPQNVSCRGKNNCHWHSNSIIK